MRLATENVIDTTKVWNYNCYRKNKKCRKVSHKLKILTEISNLVDTVMSNIDAFRLYIYKFKIVKSSPKCQNLIAICLIFILTGKVKYKIVTILIKSSNIDRAT